MKLNLGCGAHVRPDFLNIDLEGPRAASNFIAHDLSRGLPGSIRAGSVEFIYSEHFIEHISLGAARVLLDDCKRALAPGGKIRLSTPDLEYLMDSYLEWMRNGRDVSSRIPRIWCPLTPCRMVNEGMREWGHQFLYDGAEMELMLETFKFKDIRRVAWDPRFEMRPDHGEIIYEARV